MDRRIRQTALTIEELLDRRLRRRVDGRAKIDPYRGFGRSGDVIVRGRVLRDRIITRARSAEPVWRSLLNAYRRFESDEIPGAHVRVSMADATLDTITNDEGFFEARLQPHALDSQALWHDVRLELEGSEQIATGHILVPPPSATLGIISDIDDTIVQTGATSLRSMIRTVALSNAAMRTAFEGVADLYQALHRDLNPIFYVSSSPWNLYDLLSDFMDLSGIPPGPMFLQDWGLDEVTLIHAPHATHKLREIDALLAFYPELPFVLIGDSGQQDPEIYLQVIRNHPGRIRAAFIRDVTGDVRDRGVTSIADAAREAGTPMRYVADSATALREATALGILGSS
jgi:phosphatidate phosphatase APP1